MIYYGDEVGMPGAGDPDNRRFMQWSNYTANQTMAARPARRAREDPHASTRRLRRGTRQTLGVDAATCSSTR